MRNIKVKFDYTVSKNQFGFFTTMLKRYMRSGSEDFRENRLCRFGPKTKLIHVLCNLTWDRNKGSCCLKIQTVKTFLLMKF
jgi:hypothetical protein